MVVSLGVNVRLLGDPMEDHVYSALTGNREYVIGFESEATFDYFKENSPLAMKVQIQKVDSTSN